MLNFLGTTENFAVIENIPYSMTWKFFDAWTGEPIPLDGVTFSGRIFVGENGRELELDIAKGEESHLLVVGCSGLPEGRWPYEVFCVSDEGLRERMLSGCIGVIGSLEAKTVLDARPTADRTLSVRLPGDTARALKLEWLSSSLAQTAAASAWNAWEKTKETADKLEEADRKLDGLMETTQEAMDRLGQVDGLMEGIHAEVESAHQAAQKAQDILESGILQGEKGDTPVIGENGHWWISGQDTGIRAEGRDGVTPHIGANGHWWIGEQDTQVQAEGTDGMDADFIRRIYISSAKELPEEGERGVFYYIPSPDGNYDVYAWVDFPDGDSAWTPISESTLQQATVRAHGTVRLSTGTILTNGGIVGVNEAGQLLVREARTDVPGTVKLSSSKPSLISPAWWESMPAASSSCRRPQSTRREPSRSTTPNQSNAEPRSRRTRTISPWSPSRETALTESSPRAPSFPSSRMNDPTSSPFPLLRMTRASIPPPSTAHSPSTSTAGDFYVIPLEPMLKTDWTFLQAAICRWIMARAWSRRNTPPPLRG
ncbi:hypothetical protein ABFY27_10350 [Akkermansia massiliensis]